MSLPSPSALHRRTASAPSVTEQGAAMFGVDVEAFRNWRWQMKHQVQDFTDLADRLPLSSGERDAFCALRERFHAGISPYSIAAMAGGGLDHPVRRQLLPSLEEMRDALGHRDPLLEETNSPVKEVVHVYEDRVAFCVAQLCPVYCRYCFRKRRDGEEGLHFNPRIVDAGIAYIASNPRIRDVLITGGDPLIAHDGTLRNLLARLRAIPHVEILRIGTRVPVALPYRITPELADMLAEFHPLWINTHFNCVEELTPEAAQAVDILLSRGIPVGNQSVLLRGVNDSFESMRSLLQGLLKLRVRPYYLYQAQVVEGTEHLRVPIEKGLDIVRALRGRTTGFGIPQYVLDTPHGKVPLSPNTLLGRAGADVVVRTRKGTWAEPNPLDGYEPGEALPCVHSAGAARLDPCELGEG